MKLVQFSVNNYRCVQGGLEQNTVKFGDSNTIFIFGQNNVGKSSFLKAYKTYFDFVVNDDDFSFVEGEEQRQNIEMELWLLIDGSNDKELINEKSNGKYDSFSKYLEDSILKVKRIWSDVKTSKNFTWDPTTNDWVEKSYGGIGLDSVFQSMLPKPLLIQAMPTESQVKSVVNEVLKEIAETKLTKVQSDKLEAAKATIKELQNEVYDRQTINDYEREVNQEFNKLFKSYKIAIDDGTSRAKYTSDKLGMDFEIDFKHTENDQATTYERMGHGAVRMAIFLLMLMRDKLQGQEATTKSYLVLFEEPELFLHPSLTKKLRSLVYDVSARDMPFQVLCASHSPQMIDMTKEDTSLVRMTKSERETELFQVEKLDLKNEEQTTLEEVKQKVHEVLRFNPFVCESFYADEVMLVEGDTEAIILRAYQQEFSANAKDVYIVNCGTCNNIPFYQKMFSKFNIPYSVICDTDHYQKGDDEGMNRTGWNQQNEDPEFESHIQKSIANQFAEDKAKGLTRKFYVCSPTFEPYHESLAEPFKYEKTQEGKAVSANQYWEKIVKHKDEAAFNAVPIVNYANGILLDA